MFKQFKFPLFIFCFLFLFLESTVFVFSEEIKNNDELSVIQDKNKNIEIFEIEKEIKDKMERIKELEKQDEIYKRNIEIKKAQQITLNGELDILGTKINVIKNAIERTELKIKQVNLEIQDAELKILRQETKIEEAKENVGEFIRIIYYLDQKSPLEILLLNNSISDYFNQIKFVKNLEYQMQKVLDKLQIDRQIIKEEKKILEEQELKLENLKKDHKEKQIDLEEQEENKKFFLKETKNSESKFQELLLAVKKEQEQANAEIISLEKELREKLKKELEKEKETIFIWPVPKNTITAEFNDPTYIFRKYFSHNAIDIRAGQGTPIVAAASGYIGKVKNAGMGYSYILIIHNNGFSTVYGHTSKSYVKDGDYVNQGQIIGLSGGMPGTPGAGRYSTGPHLHFEIHLNSNIVNPAKYLP
jgi:murein DD-endopeptidase MepM/ murein hydrolase activator NlpD